MFDPLQTPPPKKRTVFKCTHIPRSAKDGIEVSVETVKSERCALGDLDANIDYSGICKSKSSDFPSNARSSRIGRFLITRSPKDNYTPDLFDIYGTSRSISVTITAEPTPEEQGIASKSDDILGLFC